MSAHILWTEPSDEMALVFRKVSHNLVSQFNPAKVRGTTAIIQLNILMFLTICSLALQSFSSFYISFLVPPKCFLILVE